MDCYLLCMIVSSTCISLNQMPVCSEMGSIPVSTQSTWVTSQCQPRPPQTHTGLSRSTQPSLPCSTRIQIHTGWLRSTSKISVQTDKRVESWQLLTVHLQKSSIIVFHQWHKYQPIWLCKVQSHVTCTDEGSWTHTHRPILGCSRRAWDRA